ncbi:MAG TPA: FAD-dependent oxidoreductase [Gemmatimonadales bacterium]|nr:FAD-dependent oxidoreductase [Gemmatimonadales bacterium]
MPPLPRVAQVPLSLLPEEWDVVVVGAGPAGTTAAYHLAAAGRRVLLVERAAMPRDKTCGDGLLPDAQRALARQGLLAEVRARAWIAPHGHAESPSGHRLTADVELLLLPRRVLDTLLAANAERAGAALGLGTIARVRDAGDEVELETRGGARLRARYAVLATGADLALARGCLAEAPGRAAWVAFRGYYAGTAASDASGARGVWPAEPLIVYDRALIPGYAWIFPLGASRFNVGVAVATDATGARRVDDPSVPGATARPSGTSGADSGASGLRGALRRFVATHPAAAGLVPADPAQGEGRGANLRTGLRGAAPWNGNRILLTGEMLGTTYPFTGEGIGKAMETGERAAAALLAAWHHPPEGARRALAAYGRGIREELAPRYAGYLLAERWLGRAWLNDALLWLAQRRPGLRAAASGLMDESVDAREVFTVPGIVRAALRPRPRPTSTRGCNG